MRQQLGAAHLLRLQPTPAHPAQVLDLDRLATHLPMHALRIAGRRCPVIEVTKAMCEAGWDALPVSAQETGDVDIDDMAKVIAAALAVVKRDYRTEPSPPWQRAVPPGCGAQHPHLCVSCVDDRVYGQGHGGCINCRMTGYDQTPWPQCQECQP